MLSKKHPKKILFFRESTFKVAELIFTYPNRVFHLRLLEKETGFSTTAIISSIEELESYSIVLIQQGPLTKNISANIDSYEYNYYKLVFNIYRLKKYGFIDSLIEIYQTPETIALFGSYAKGEDIEESDIDFLVISTHKPQQTLLNNFILKMEKELKRKVNIHHIPNLKKSSDAFRNTAANGIVLYGYLKVI